jgi:tRNA-specific adenosine deaminase 1
MELTIAAQDDNTPWALPPESPNRDISIATDLEMSLKGRGYFSELGIVRRKPSRPDAPPTLSKSCSDKLALKQCTSLLSSPVSLLISPENAYLRSLTLPESQYSVSACERAFGPCGRMAPLHSRKWDGGYRYHPFQIRTAKSEFSFSRRGGSSSSEKLVPSNLAAAWTPYGEETLIGGVRQGRKQFDPRGAGMMCKRNMWKLALDVAAMISVPTIYQALDSDSYQRVKKSDLLNRRRIVKEEVKGKALQGWIPNGGDDFGLEFAIA